MLRTFPTSKSVAVFMLATFGAVGCSKTSSSGSGKASTIAPSTSQISSSTAATFLAMTPTSGPAGTLVTITCKNVSKSATVDFAGVPVVPAYSLANGVVTLTAKVPTTAVTGAVHVKDTASGVTLTCGTFTISGKTTPTPNPSPSSTPVKPAPTPSLAPSPAPSTAPVSPAVTSMSPMAGKVGDTVSITCTNLGSAVSVDFGGVVAATPTSHGINGAVILSVVVPTGATTGTVYVSSTVNGKVVAVSAGTFTISGTTAPTPAVSSMTPVTGAVATPVKIVCTGIAATNIQVNFNNTAAIATVNSSSAAGTVEVDTVVPAGATTGHVYVYDQAAGKTLDAGNFTVSGATTPPTPGAVKIVTAMIDDTNLDHVVSAGDLLTVTFDAPVKVTATDPTGQIDLLVAGDTFGTGATMAAGTAATDVVITLGAAPKLRITGTYDAASTAGIKASGLDVDSKATGIAPVATGSVLSPTAAGVDVDSTTLVEGVNLAGVSLVNSRGLHSATLLQDGRVLIVGGVTADTAGSAYYQGENEIFDPSTNTIMEVSNAALGGPTGGYMTHKSAKTGNPFEIARYGHVAILRNDGRVMIIGGHGIEAHDAKTDAPIYSELASVFVFNPTTNKFVETSPLKTARRDAMGALLPNGQVLVFGGRDLNGTVNSSEIYDPGTGTWSAGPTMVTDRYDAATVSYTGGIFVAGGAQQTGRQTANPVLTMCTGDELYDPVAKTFGAAASLATPRRAATATFCDSSDFLVVGGTDVNGASLASVERYDHAAKAFVSAGNLAEARSRHSAVAFESNVLAIGGMDQSLTSPYTVTNIYSVEVLDQANGAVASYSLNDGRLSATATKLQDGRVLILGGFDASGGSDPRGLDGLSSLSAEAEVFTRP